MGTGGESQVSRPLRPSRPGETPPTTVRLDLRAKAELARLAKAHGVSQAEVVRRLVLGLPLGG